MPPWTPDTETRPPLRQARRAWRSAWPRSALNNPLIFADLNHAETTITFNVTEFNLADFIDAIEAQVSQ